PGRDRAVVPAGGRGTAAPRCRCRRGARLLARRDAGRGEHRAACACRGPAPARRQRTRGALGDGAGANPPGDPAHAGRRSGAAARGVDLRRRLGAPDRAGGAVRRLSLGLVLVLAASSEALGGARARDGGTLRLAVLAEVRADRWGETPEGAVLRSLVAAPLCRVEMGGRVQPLLASFQRTAEGLSVVPR